ncbi:hypothetical protein COCVIDRAFT_40069 [Bipolaris victoriae FI3]|uniref:Uncharacterized protein n=1 Tax=Bipolaris victoriae (strain FI3) TaxID=930091 RepID=W7E1T4_BIPV3|nr:hypothetical protein COCVIDRAFT_40069 [Bipolaris victoriae FI3]
MFTRFFLRTNSISYTFAYLRIKTPQCIPLPASSNLRPFIFNCPAESSITFSSIFHQLHCLAMIQSIVQGLKEDTNPAHIHMRHDHGHRGPRSGIGNKHWQHCFDYLRQIILCNDDPAIEEPRINSTGTKFIDVIVKRQFCDHITLFTASVESFRYANEEIRTGKRKFAYHD